MQGFIEQLVLLDRDVVEAAATLRTPTATAFFALVSAWWIKGPLFVAVALGRDAYNRMLPLTAFVVVAAFAAGDAASGSIKQAVDRPRPPVDDPQRLDAAVAVPASPSFPSGHATTSFAAAGAVAVLVPRLRVPAFAMAALVGFSRIYLGVHYTIDVLCGALLGTLIGVSIALAAKRAFSSRLDARDPASVLAPSA